MGIDVLLSLVAGLVSAVAGAGMVLATDAVQKIIRQLLGIRSPPEKPYSQRLAELTASLAKS